MTGTIALSPADREAVERMLSGGRKPRFSPVDLGDKLMAKYPAAKAGGALFAYRDGQYLDGAEEFYGRQVARELGPEFRMGRKQEILGYIETVAPELWDTPPHDLLNVANGLLDLDKMKLQPHTPEFLVPGRTPVHFRPNAKGPEGERFLASSLGDELTEMLYEIVGYLLTPDMWLQLAFMFLGGGGGGKSTTLGWITALLGPGSVSHIPLHKLDERFMAAELHGKRANIFGDLDHRGLDSSSMFKALVGGDPIPAERKNAPPFTFRPYCRLLFSTNTPPPTADNTYAYYRRWSVIPFERTFTPDSRDPDLLAKLTTGPELSALMMRGLERLPDLRSRGRLTVAQAAQDAADRFREESDSVSGFFREKLEVDPDGRVPQARTFPAYRAWCEEANRRPLGKQRFNRRLIEIAPTVHEVKSGGIRYWGGIRASERGEL